VSAGVDLSALNGLSIFLLLDLAVNLLPVPTLFADWANTLLWFADYTSASRV